MPRTALRTSFPLRERLANHVLQTRSIVDEPLEDEHPHDQDHDCDDPEHRPSHLEEVANRLVRVIQKLHCLTSSGAKRGGFSAAARLSARYVRSACRATIPALCSCRICTMLRARPFTIVCSSTVGMATTRPSTVVTRACEIPDAITVGSPVPNSVIAWKVWIMPVTVPSRPSSGATTEITLMNRMPRCSLGTSFSIDSPSFSSRVSVSAFGLS